MILQSSNSPFPSNSRTLIMFLFSIKSCDIDKLMKIGAVLVQGLNKLIEECKDVRISNYSMNLT